MQSQNTAPSQSPTSSSPNLVKLINMNKLNSQTIKTSQSVASPTQFSIKSNGLIASSNTPKPLIMINNLNHPNQSNTSK